MPNHDLKSTLIENMSSPSLLWLAGAAGVLYMTYRYMIDHRNPRDTVTINPNGSASIERQPGVSATAYGNKVGGNMKNVAIGPNADAQANNNQVGKDFVNKAWDGTTRYNNSKQKPA